MKHPASTGDPDEHLQVQVPSLTKRHLDVRAAETREPIRVIVLKALEAYGIPVPEGAISDRRRNRIR
ncbi:hypothetical protein EOD23_01980 [Mesorhizobium sp. USDA-HM6]|nr:hypothetical protein EOD23_01980 [Mesorhizobium sp. USDA-HM6]